MNFLKGELGSAGAPPTNAFASEFTTLKRRMSKLPNAEDAIVEEIKITGYLLSTTHSSGRFKAQFFGSFGFQLEAWEKLREALLRHALENELSNTAVTEFGIKYQIDGPLAAADGRRPRIRAVWFIEAGAKIPRLVTAHPV